MKYNIRKEENQFSSCIFLESDYNNFLKAIYFHVIVRDRSVPLFGGRAGGGGKEKFYVLKKRVIPFDHSAHYRNDSFGYGGNVGYHYGCPCGGSRRFGGVPG